MIKISVCIGSSCHLKGSYNVINGFQHVIEKNKVSDKVEIYDNYIISSLNYYNYNGEQIYTLGG